MCVCCVSPVGRCGSFSRGDTLLMDPQRRPPLQHALMDRPTGPPSAVRRPPSAVNRPPSAVNRPPSAIHRPPSAVRRPPPAVNRPPSCRPPSATLPSAIYHPPSVVCRPSSTVYRPPPVVCRLPRCPAVHRPASVARPALTAGLTCRHWNPLPLVLCSKLSSSS